MLPKIARPCPYIDRLDSVIDEGFCRMCHREVHDLTGMDARERDTFVAACGGDVCISFTGLVRPAIAAAAIAASAAVLVTSEPAFAGDTVMQSDRTWAVQTGPTRLPRPMVPIRTAGLPPPPPVKSSPPASSQSPDGKPAETRHRPDLDGQGITGG